MSRTDQPPRQHASDEDRNGKPTPELPEEINGIFHWLRWAALLAPLLLVAVLEGSRYFLSPYISPVIDRVALVILLVVLSLICAILILKPLETLNQRLIRQNQELLGLHQAGLAVVAELSLEAVLQKVVDQARSLLEARYGALSVTDGDQRIEAFITSGMNDEESRLIGDPPKGQGLLGVVLQQGERLRLGEMSSDPRATGFPLHHPDLKSLLAVPVVCEKSPYRGNLYLSEKEDDTPFHPEDEETLVRFATQAAIAIDNAYLHRRIAELAAAEERLHIAHDMHDGLAQLIAYVNAKVQAARENLLQNRLDTAAEQLDQLSVTARQAYGDVRSQILDLRSSSRAGRGELADTLETYVEQWRQQSGLRAELELEGELHDLEPMVELQLLRIIQESLANVRKHAGASCVQLNLKRVERSLEVQIQDDGQGFDPDRLTPSASPRFGLSTMRERAASIGARLHIRSELKQGTTVTVHVPNAQLKPEIYHATGHRG
ncbi:MAG: GAF domain-containing sensor histidine kinase [Acidobacteriota bacterium]|nr:GAF domain-containing sensor histidine kinase [Acidobacteriota bacterium]